MRFFIDLFAQFVNALKWEKSLFHKLLILCEAKWIFVAAA